MSNLHYLSNPYLSEEDTDRIIALIRSVQARIMIEFGCQQGRTARTILKSVPGLERYYGVDVPPDYQPSLECQLGEVPGRAALFVRDDPRFVLMIREHGTYDLTALDLPRCDAVFIDGDHSREGVSHDSHLALAVVRSPGVIIWHDYGNPVTEVMEVLDELRKDGWPIEFIEGTWLAYRRMA